MKSISQSIRRFIPLLLALLVMPAVATSAEIDFQKKALENIALFELAPIAQELIVRVAVKEHNDANGEFSEELMAELDEQWQLEAVEGQDDLMEETLNNKAAVYLTYKQKVSGGLITEILLMDDQGRLVAASEVTSDYWQGDEAKWQKTFLVGPDAVFIDDVELDASTGRLQAQISLTITDFENKTAIGAITFGIDSGVLGNPGANK